MKIGDIVKVKDPKDCPHNGVIFGFSPKDGAAQVRWYTEGCNYSVHWKMSMLKVVDELHPLRDEDLPDKMELTNVYTESGDWEGWYLNDRLLSQGHSVPASHVLSEIGLTIRKSIELSCEEIEELGCMLPNSLDEVMSAKR